LRGVLLSPLLVLILYLTFRSPHPAASSAARGYYRHSPASSMHAPARTLGDPQQQLQPLQAAQQPVLVQESYTTAGDGGEEAPAWVVVAPPPAEGQQEPHMAASAGAASASMLDASSTIVRPRPQPKRLVSNYYSPQVAAPQHLIRDATNHQHQNRHRIVVQPSHLRRDEEPQLLLAPQQMQQQPMQMQMQMAAQPLQAAEGDSEPVSLVLQQQQQPYMGSSSSSSTTAGAVDPESAPIVLRPPIPLQAGEPLGDQELLPDALVSAPLQQDAVVQQQQPQLAMARRGKNSGAQNRQRGGDSGGASASSTVVYYYYDPRDVPTDPRTGQLAGNRLPPIVYDPNGNPHWLSTIRAKEILLEAPPLGQASSPAVQAAAEPPADVADANLVGSAWTSAAMVQAGGGSGGSGSSGPIPQWGESTATDQSIIVCTVGIMALLVGAVSARRFRRQSFLSACIENEALDSQHGDDAALPYGTGGLGDGASSSYRTFEGWKGDLEKFDV
jgi:hypothetical protein